MSLVDVLSFHVWCFSFADGLLPEDLSFSLCLLLTEVARVKASWKKKVSVLMAALLADYLIVGCAWPSFIFSGYLASCMGRSTC